jgi:steroid delta-isomerase-like uncharacterized protein
MKEPAMSAENKALVSRWFEEVWTNGRAELIEELLAADSSVYGLGPDLHGAAAFKPFYAAYRTAFPDVAVRIDDVIAEGDIVAARWTATGTHQGDGLGFPATGKKVRFTGMVFVRVANGKMIEGWNSFDQLGMLQQLGVVNLPEAV